MPTQPEGSSGHFAGGWGEFYASNSDNLGNPHLRTYNGPQAEKVLPKASVPPTTVDCWSLTCARSLVQSGQFYETSILPLVPARPGKAAPPPSKDSLTWGVGGTLPQGRYHGKPGPAADFRCSQKKYIPEKGSTEIVFSKDTGNKRHVFDEYGDRHDRRSESYFLESVLQRKAKVPEEMRSDHRTIHRMAPPGLKGYMGAEYSNDFFKRPPPEEQVAEPSKPRKTFKQKRAEEEVALQVDLVTHELGAIPLSSGDDEVNLSDDERETTEADKVFAD